MHNQRDALFVFSACARDRCIIEPELTLGLISKRFSRAWSAACGRKGELILRTNFIVLAAAFFLSACAGAPAPTPADIRQIVSTTSFGMCVGYCTTRLEISPGRAVLIRQARGGRGAPQNLPDQRFATVLTPDEWSEIERLAANTNLSDLPPVIGCPDCADGGAESLTIEGSSQPQTVSFEHNASIAQAAPLLERVRALRTRLTPQE